MNMSYLKNYNGKEEILLRNLWTLLHSNEFVIFKLNENSNMFPKVLGFCGHFYVVEAVSYIKSDIVFI